MTQRLRILVAVLVALGVLTVVDRPQPDLPEVSEGVARTEHRPAAGKAVAVQPRGVLTEAVLRQGQAAHAGLGAAQEGAQVLMAGADEDAVAFNEPVPDLFAPRGGASTATASQGAEGGEGAAKADGPAKPFALLGFKQEDGVREAYLLRNGDVVTARAGAVLEQRYRVLVLQEDAVHIKDNVSGASFRIGFEDHQ